MLNKLPISQKLTSVIIAGALFVILNSIELFIASTIQFKNASATEKALRYVNEPSIIFSVIISFIIVATSCLVYKLVGVFKQLPLWLNGTFALIASATTIYIFSTFSLVGNSGFLSQVRIFLRILALAGLNFFIPYVEYLLKK